MPLHRANPNFVPPPWPGTTPFGTPSITGSDTFDGALYNFFAQILDEAVPAFGNPPRKIFPVPEPVNMHRGVTDPRSLLYPQINPTSHAGTIPFASMIADVENPAEPLLPFAAIESPPVPAALSPNPFAPWEKQLTPTTIGEIAKHIQEGGVTYKVAGHHPRNLAGEPGFAVSVYPERSAIMPQEEFTAGKLTDYIHQNRDLLSRPGHDLGGWLDNGKVYLDVSSVIPDRAAATALGRSFNQKAITDLSKIPHDFDNAFIETGGTGEPTPLPSGKSMADWTEARAQLISDLSRRVSPTEAPPLFKGYGSPFPADIVKAWLEDNNFGAKVPQKPKLKLPDYYAYASIPNDVQDNVEALTPEIAGVEGEP